MLQDEGHIFDRPFRPWRPVIVPRCQAAILLVEVAWRAAITGSDTVAVYDLESGQQLGRELPYRPIRITYSADGSKLAVAGDYRVTIWKYDTDTWADLTCQLAGSNFTEEEWKQIGPRTIERRATCPEFPLW